MTTTVDREEQGLVASEEQLLVGIRRVLGPRPLDQARVRRGLSGCLAAGVVAPELPASLSQHADGHVPRWATAGIQGLAKQLVAALAIGSAGFGAGLLTGRALPRDTIDARAAPRKAASTEPVQRAVDTAASVAQPPQSVENLGEPALPKRTVPAAANEPVPNARAVDARTLTEEADALRRAGLALSEGQPAMAGQILDDLDSRIPRGALGEERRAARLMVRCRTGDATAQAAARMWLISHARSVYAPRVRASCGERDPGERTPEATER